MVPVPMLEAPYTNRDQVWELMIPENIRGCKGRSRSHPTPQLLKEAVCGFPLKRKRESEPLTEMNLGRQLNIYPYVHPIWNPMELTCSDSFRVTPVSSHQKFLSFRRKALSMLNLWRTGRCRLELKECKTQIPKALRIDAEEEFWIVAMLDLFFFNQHLPKINHPVL